MKLHSPPRHSLARALALATACLFAASAFAGDPGHGKVKVKKYYDANANGIRNSGEPVLEGWPMTLSSATAPIESTRYTDATGVARWLQLKPGNDYIVTEGTPVQGNWFQSSPLDMSGTPINPQTGILAVPGHETWVRFMNYCTVESGGRTPGFWGNRNGVRTMNDDGSMAPELELLSSLNLRDGSGMDFDPASHAVFRTWLLRGNAVNMAYKLSVHLAAMTLNVESGLVDGGVTFVPCDCTIDELLDDADQSLQEYPLTLSGHPQRADQEQLKDWLDALNNGAQVISPVPCTYTFN